MKNSHIEKILVNPKRTSDWITPQEYTKALGKFQLDPCASINQRWHHASLNWTIKEDGLSKDWMGRVWLNPPYSQNTHWLKKMAEHNNGIALIPARTDTRWFLYYVFKKASSILFLKGRIKFYGSENYAKNSCPFPVCFVSYDLFPYQKSENRIALQIATQENFLFDGFFLDLIRHR